MVFCVGWRAPMLARLRTCEWRTHLSPMACYECKQSTWVCMAAFVRFLTRIHQIHRRSRLRYPDSIFDPCLLDLHLQKVGGKMSRNCYHGCTGNHSLKSVCKWFKNLYSLIGHILDMMGWASSYLSNLTKSGRCKTFVYRRIITGIIYSP